MIVKPKTKPARDNNTLSIVKKISANAPTIEVYKSTDGTNWTSMGNTDTTAITATIPANGRLYLKATADAWGTDGGSGWNSITASASYNVGGNIMSLLYGDNFESQTTLTGDNNYCFWSLFRDNRSTPDSYLINTNKLILPATILSWSCYSTMFSGCNRLETAPVLPATTLARNCYGSMFSKCTSLTTAPVLPATTLADNCYYAMFNGCSNLNNVTTYASNISASYCLNNWLNNVAATGDFYNYGGATYETGASGIPGGWTEHTS